MGADAKTARFRYTPTQANAASRWSPAARATGSFTYLFALSSPAGLGRHRAAQSGKNGHARYQGKTASSNGNHPGRGPVVLKEHDEATVETLDNTQKLLESVASFIESTVQERDKAVTRSRICDGG